MKPRELLQDKHPETGEVSGTTSFARVFAAITGISGNVLIIAAVYSTMFQDPVRIFLDEGIKYGAGLILFAMLIYSGAAVKLAVNVISARYGRPDS